MIYVQVMRHICLQLGTSGIAPLFNKGNHLCGFGVEKISD